MTLEDFKNSLSQADPPDTYSPYLQSLWWEGKGNWEHSHNIAQDIPDRYGAWIHAYLHRKEGDDWNANYWYRRADRTMPKSSLEAEWESLVRFFLEQAG